MDKGYTTDHQRQLRWTSVLGLAVRAASAALALGSQIVLARCMRADQFGVYIIVVAWTTIVATMAGVGMPLAAIRFLPAYRMADDQPRLIGFVRRSCHLIAIGSTAGIVVFLAIALGDPVLGQHARAAIIGAPLIPLLAFAGLVAAIMQASLQPLRAEILNNIIRPCLVIISVLGMFHLRGDPVDAIWALAMTSAAALLALSAGLVMARRDIPRDDAGRPLYDQGRTWLASGLAFMVPMVSMAMIERVDTIILGSVAGGEEAGIYSVAARLSQMAGLAIVSVNALMAPMAAGLHARGDRAGLQRLLASAALLNTGLVLLIALGLVMLGPWLLAAFGPAFVAGAGTMHLLLIGQIAQAACGAAGGILALTGHNRPIVIVMPIAMLGHAGACLLVIPAFGQAGAAITGAITLALLSIAQTVIAARVLHVDTSILAGLRLLVRSGRLNAKSTERT